MEHFDNNLDNNFENNAKNCEYGYLSPSSQGSFYPLSSITTLVDCCLLCANKNPVIMEYIQWCKLLF